MFRPLLEVEWKKRAPFWCEVHLQAKTYKTRQLRSTFRSWDVEKVHGDVAHFEVQMSKHFSFGAFLEVEILKKCTPLEREAHLEVNMLKTLGVRTTF